MACAALAVVTEQVSVSSLGIPKSGAAGNISADGRYVVFISDSDDVVEGDTNGVRDVFVQDRQTGITERVSVASGYPGEQANGPSCEQSPFDSDVPESAWISGNGRYVVFSSSASNLVSGDTNGLRDIFVRDRVSHTTVRASVSSSGHQSNGTSCYPSISADGARVVFVSLATNLVSGDTNGALDVFLRDLPTGNTYRANLSSANAQALGQQTGQGVLDYDITARISGDGLHVAFVSSATNLVSGDTNGTYDMFVRDLNPSNAGSGSTERMSVSTSGQQGNGFCWGNGDIVSYDGSVVAFSSFSTNLDEVIPDTNGENDVFVRDRQAHTTRRISIDWQGNEVSTRSSDPSCSADGSMIMFHNDSDDLLPGGDGVMDVYIVGKDGTGLERVGVDSTGTPLNGWDAMGFASSDGRFVTLINIPSTLNLADARAMVVDRFALTISDAKKQPDDASVIVSGGVASAVFTDAFYFQQDGVASPARACGIRVAWTGVVAVGKRYIVTGTMETNSDGERYIEATAVDAHTSEWTIDVRPLGMPNKILGGGNLAYDPVSGAGQIGVTDGAGLNNIGLLVRTTGSCTYVNAHTFTIDDGSGVSVTCVTPSTMLANPAWQYAAVTGVSSIRKTGETYSRLLRVTKVDPIVSQPSEGVTGRWEVILTSGPGSGVWGMLLTQSGNAIIGNVAGNAITNGQMNGNVCTGSVDLWGTPVVFSLVRDGETLSGTWSLNDGTFPMAFQRLSLDPVSPYSGRPHVLAATCDGSSIDVTWDRPVNGWDYDIRDSHGQSIVAGWSDYGNTYNPVTHTLHIPLAPTTTFAPGGQYTVHLDDSSSVDWHDPYGVAAWDNTADAYSFTFTVPGGGEPGSVTGRWEATATSGWASGVLGMLLVQQGSAVSGTLLGLTLQNGQMSGGVFTASITSGYGSDSLQLSLNGDTLTGTFADDGDGGSRPITFQRVSTDPVSPYSGRPSVLSATCDGDSIDVTWDRPVVGWDRDVRDEHGMSIIDDWDSSGNSYDPATHAFHMPMPPSTTFVAGATYTIMLESGDYVDWHDPYGSPAWDTDADCYTFQYTAPGGGEPGDVTGRWEMTNTSGNGCGVYGMLLTQQDTAVQGSVRGLSIANGVMDGNVFTGQLVVDGDTGTISFSLTLDGDTLAGTQTIGSEVMPVTFHRVSTDPVSPYVGRPQVLSATCDGSSIDITWDRPINGWDAVIYGSGVHWSAEDWADKDNFSYNPATNSFHLAWLSSIPLVPGTQYTVRMESGDPVDWHDPYGAAAWDNIADAYSFTFTARGGGEPGNVTGRWEMTRTSGRPDDGACGVVGMLLTQQGTAVQGSVRGCAIANGAVNGNVLTGEAVFPDGAMNWSLALDGDTLSNGTDTLQRVSNDPVSPYVGRPHVLTATCDGSSIDITWDRPINGWDFSIGNLDGDDWADRENFSYNPATHVYHIALLPSIPLVPGTQYTVTLDGGSVDWHDPYGVAAWDNTADAYSFTFTAPGGGEPGDVTGRWEMAMTSGEGGVFGLLLTQQGAAVQSSAPNTAIANGAMNGSVFTGDVLFPSAPGPMALSLTLDGDTLAGTGTMGSDVMPVTFHRVSTDPVSPYVGRPQVLSATCDGSSIDITWDRHINGWDFSIGNLDGDDWADRDNFSYNPVTHVYHIALLPSIPLVPGTQYTVSLDGGSANWHDPYGVAAWDNTADAYSFTFTAPGGGEPGNVTGRWEMTNTSGGICGVLGMLLTQQGTAVQGSVRGLAIAGGAMNGNVCTGGFVVDDYTEISSSMTLDGDTLTGTWTIVGEGYVMPVAFHRVSNDPVSPYVGRPQVLSATCDGASIDITWDRPVSGWDYSIRRPNVQIGGDMYELEDQSNFSYDPETHTYHIALTGLPLVPSLQYTVALDDGDSVDWHDPYGAPAWPTTEEAYEFNFSAPGNPEDATLTVYATGTYEVWATRTHYQFDGSLGLDGYAKIGEASSTASFDGTYEVYFILPSSTLYLDAIKMPCGTFMDMQSPFPLHWLGTSNALDWMAVSGPPDGVVCTLSGYCAFAGPSPW